MNSIEPQAVAMVVPQPHERVVHEEAAHLIAAFRVEVNCVSPWRLAVCIEVGAELGGLVAYRSKVVVNDVKDHA